MTETKEGFSDPYATHGGWRWDLDTPEVSWSQALYRIHGVTPESFDPQPDEVRKLIHPDDFDRYRRSVSEAIRTRAPFTVQHRIVRPDGAVRILIVKGAVIPSGNGSGDVLVGTTEDVTERERADDRLWFLANHDSLTGLFNRRRLLEELERELAVAMRTGRPGAVLMLDLDEFKDVNDLLGHVAGDTVLTRVGEALQARLRATDALARLGGDEFAVVLPDCGVGAAQRVGFQLIEAVRSISAPADHRFREVGVSVGVAPFRGDPAQTSDIVLVQADLAMYRAKQRGGGCVEVFDERIRAELADRLEIEGDLRDALDDGQLCAFYQPIVSMDDGAPIGCESLVRWHHPTRGLLEPDAFIPIAEERGLIGRLGAAVLFEACAQARIWRDAGRRLFVTVNVSPRQLLYDDDIVRLVESALSETGLPASMLCLEVTETSLVEDVTKLSPALNGIKELGVRVAIDDFGGGSSSLSFLSALPIDVIKIDRMFVEGVSDRADDRAIVAAVISLAQELELMVIAEGVETERQQSDLRELGCSFGQGFLYSRPLEASALELDGYSAAVQPGVGDPSVVLEFMRQIGIPAARM